MTTKESEVDVRTYLTDEQVYALNEKHGWFQHGDAQSDVSRAFANEAVAMHERVRAAAPQLLAAIKSACEWMETATVESWNDDPPLAQARTALRNAGVKA